jgi:type I restriction enzyme S subunit
MNKIITTLGAVAEIITGPFGTQLHMSDYIEVGIPVIMPQNIENRSVNETGIARISDNDFMRLQRYSVKENDLIFPRRGDIEKHAFINNNFKALCGTGCFRVRVIDSNVYPLFLSLYLDRTETKKWITTHAVGSNMPNLNTDILASVPLELPSYNEQVKIGNWLYKIEKKIQCNNAINDNLVYQSTIIA